MPRLPSCRHAVVLCWFVWLAGVASGQSGPGVPKLIFDQSELFTIISKIGQPQGSKANHGHSMMHDGYLAVFHASPGGVEFYDVSNPYRPFMVQSITQGMGDLGEPHTFAQTNAYGGQHVMMMRGPGGLGTTGLAIWDWTDIFNPRQVARFDVPGVSGGYATGIFWLFYQAPYIYAGAGSLGLYIIDASVPSNPRVVRNIPTSRTGGFNAVNTVAVGNMLVITNSDGGPGMARLDISDPLDPQLLDASTRTSIPYGVMVNGDRLVIPAVSGPISGAGNAGSLDVRDLYATGFPQVNEISLPSRGGFLTVQDGFAHIGASASYVVVDFRNDNRYSIVGRASANNSGGDEDYATVIGNFTAVGDDQGYGTALVPHRAQPDNTGPSVTMVVPRDGATQQALTTRVGITLSDMVELLSIDKSTFAVRPVGGQALNGVYANQFGIVNFTPDRPLQPDTTYEVTVAAGGIRDWSGNAVPVTFVSRFSTGVAVTAIDVTVQRQAPVSLGQSTNFNVASVSGPGPLRYSWDFGDGSPRTPLTSSSQATHVYSAAGHYAALVTVTNGSITATDSYVQTVHYPVTAVSPTRSSTIAIDESSNRVWCVNADNDTATAIDMQSLQRLFEVPVGDHPRTLARAPDGTIWVVCQDDATIHVLDPSDGSNLKTIALPYASAPYGIAMNPNGSAAYVTLVATGSVAALDPVARNVTATTPVGPVPRGIAVAADGERIFVTRFISSTQPPTQEPSQLPALKPGWDTPNDRAVAEVRELSAARFARVRTIALRSDPGPDNEASGRGLPNYLSSLAISPDGRRLWVPSKKDNIERGVFRDGQPLTFESTVRTIVSQIDLARDREVAAARIDFNDRDMAFAVAFSKLGDYAFHVLQGGNAVDVRDAYTGAVVAAIEGTGLAPQGLVLSSDGRRLFVHNFMSRTVGAYDVGGVTSSTNFAMPRLGEVDTVTQEALSPTVLRGKQIFYNAADPRMNEDGYISCASCHLDGGHDGTTWDFTGRGEGLRNTVTLLGRAGMGQGNVHWTANFDEIQDFENDIRFAFGGDGFMSDKLFNSSTVSDPLGHPKAGLSADLDALAAYVASLTQFGLSPHRNSDGTLTAAAQNGLTIFTQLNCAQCHSGAGFTDSPSGVRHDVGTIRPASGQARGGPLTGFDTPTLRGLWSSAPYLHDGSAPRLIDVLVTRNRQGRHGATAGLTAQQRQDLVAYLLQIDDLEPAPR